jgi:hypothetical protein
MMTIVVNAEEQFGVRIPDDEVKNLTTVGDAVTFIASNAGLMHHESTVTPFAPGDGDRTPDRPSHAPRTPHQDRHPHVAMPTRSIPDDS